SGPRLIVFVLRWKAYAEDATSFKKTATWCCAFLPKTWGETWTSYSTASREHSIAADRPLNRDNRLIGRRPSMGAEEIDRHAQDSAGLDRRQNPPSPVARADTDGARARDEPEEPRQARQP